MSDYTPPVDRLLTYGDETKLGRDWSNYVEELGLEPAHIPDLIRLATDMDMHSGDADVAVWAPIHALRALGQLRAEAAIEPLLPLLHEIDADWLQENLIDVFGLIGAAAIPALTEFLANPANDLWARVRACSSLKKIALNYPDDRAACIAALTGQLERFTRNSLELNGFLVGSLAELKAVESVAVIERAFNSRRVDLSISGDWEDVQVELGLKEADPNRRRRFDPFARLRGSVDFATAAMPYTPRDVGFGKDLPKSGKAKSKKKKK